MIEDESGVMRQAGVWTKSHFSYHGSYVGDYLQFVLGEFADYSTGELLITEEELLRRTEELLELRAMERSGMLSDMPKHYQIRLWSGFDAIFDFKELTGFVNGEPVSMVPIYSTNGGVTAEIVSYAAVNANTECAQEAFFVLDYLLGTEVQRQKFFSVFIYEGGVPLHEQMMAVSYGKTTRDGSLFSNDCFEEFNNVREQITYTRFKGGLDSPINKMFIECERAYQDGRSDEIQDYVTACYTEMLNMLQ